jgi:hypothetical protein
MPLQAIVKSAVVDVKKLEDLNKQALGDHV